MSEANKALVRQFYALMNDGRVDEAFALASDDSTWWLSGSLPNSGTADKQSQVEAARQSSAAFEGGLKLEIHSIIAEGDRVAIELEANARLRSGMSYHQQYSQHILIRNGKIQAMRNYIDTDHARRLMEAMG